MLMTMEPKIQRNLENLHANDMLKELKTLFAQQAEQELLQTTRDFHSCKQEKGQFVQNYNMHSLGKTVNELHAMLKLHEQTPTLPKNNAPALHAIRAGKVQKGKKHKKPQPQMAARGQNQGKGKNKHAKAPSQDMPPSPNGKIPQRTQTVIIVQEFLDHLKDHGIIAHRTPPYTPQHNGVSERRNRTLLDMVRSMMSQTTLPKSFWDYALETAACILNMVPTKKVEKTPYEQVGVLEDLKIIQEDTHPSIDTSSNHEEDDLEIDEPQSDIIPIHPDLKMAECYNVEMQSMGKDKEVRDLVNTLTARPVVKQWLFQEETEHGWSVHTYKARLVSVLYSNPRD
ncbi:zinc finger, CCHC-type containing protein [Tanacetum coccineum]